MTYDYSGFVEFNKQFDGYESFSTDLFWQKVREQDRAIHEKRKTGLQTRTGVGTQKETQPRQGQSPAQLSEGNGG